jgi:peptidoglycan/xylan/chitin deacetylase (PgdA/CDA1 family)
MRIVSPLLKKVVYPALSAAGVFHHTSAAGLAVVTYHGIVPPGYEPIDAALDGNLVSADTLRRQLRLLKSHYNVISPDEVLRWRQGLAKLPERAVLVTCDDGLLNCLTDMLPVLQEERVRCLFFVTGASAGESRTILWYEELFLTLLRAADGWFEVSAEGMEIRGKLGARAERRVLWWNLVKRLSQLEAVRRSAFVSALQTRLASKATLDIDLDVDLDVDLDLGDERSSSCRRFGLLTRSELRQLVAAGMSIGAHTLSHPILSHMPRELAYAEISNSRLQLESAVYQAAGPAIGQTIWAFAYPFGDAQSVTPEVLAMTQRAGYDAAFLNFGGGLGAGLPTHALPRVHISADMNLAEFDAHVSGFYMRLQRGAGRSTQSASVAQSIAS